MDTAKDARSMIPLSHANDPDTSVDAESRIVGKQKVFRAIQQILSAQGPLPAFAITEQYFSYRLAAGWPLVDEYSIKRRCSEMLQMGLLRRTGETVETPSGRGAKVLEVAK